MNNSRPVNQDPGDSAQARAAMERTCAACAQPVDVSARFCMSCGQPMSSAPAKGDAGPGATSESQNKALAALVETAINRSAETAVPSNRRGFERTCGCGAALLADARFCHRCGVKHSASNGAYRLVCDGVLAVDVSERGVLIGSDARCDLVLRDDRYVSRQHARISIEHEQILLEDLASSNGTLLRIRRSIPLETGDEIVVGTSRIRLERSVT